MNDTLRGFLLITSFESFPLLHFYNKHAFLRLRLHNKIVIKAIKNNYESVFQARLA